MRAKNNCSFQIWQSFIDFDLASSHSGSEPSLLQFYQVLPSLKQFVDYTQRILCSKGDMVCDEFASSVSFVDSLDIDYDVRSRSFSILGYQSQSPNISQQVGWSETIHGNPAKAHKVEIGVLSMQSPMEKGKLTVGGFLAVVGENEEPSMHFFWPHPWSLNDQLLTYLKEPTLFSFPARYHPLPRKYRYSASFIEPTGLHPTLQLSISQSSLTRPPAPPEFTCSLHTYLSLPSAIFADKYQLSTADPLFFHSNNLLALNSITGETDLEAPVWTLNRWGSNVLVELPQTLLTPTFGSLNATIPLHLRYQSPSPTGHKTIQVPWPVVFWACTPDRGPKKAISPFDRTSLEYDSFFRRSTRFYMLNPDPQSGHSLVETVQVPVLAKDLSPGSGYFTRQSVSEALIIATVLVGFFFVLYKLDVVARRFRIRGNLSPRLSERKRD